MTGSNPVEGAILNAVFPRNYRKCGVFIFKAKGTSEKRKTEHIVTCLSWGTKFDRRRLLVRANSDCGEVSCGHLIRNREYENI